jgi:hypothetical protein
MTAAAVSRVQASRIEEQQCPVRTLEAPSPLEATSWRRPLECDARAPECSSSDSLLVRQNLTENLTTFSENVAIAPGRCRSAHSTHRGPWDSSRFLGLWGPLHGSKRSTFSGVESLKFKV